MLIHLVRSLIHLTPESSLIHLTLEFIARPATDIPPRACESQRR